MSHVHEASPLYARHAQCGAAHATGGESEGTRARDGASAARSRARKPPIHERDSFGGLRSAVNAALKLGTGARSGRGAAYSDRCPDAAPVRRPLFEAVAEQPGVDAAARLAGITRGDAHGGRGVVAALVADAEADRGVAVRIGAEVERRDARREVAAAIAAGAAAREVQVDAV